MEGLLLGCLALFASSEAFMPPAAPTSSSSRATITRTASADKRSIRLHALDALDPSVVAGPLDSLKASLDTFSLGALPPFLVSPTTVVGTTALGMLGLRMYTYFTAQVRRLLI